MNIKQLEKAGFAAAAGMVKHLQDRKRRLTLAYEHYRYVTQEQIDKFQERCKAAGVEVENPGTANIYHKYAQLAFTPIADYTGQGNQQGLPPTEVLDAVTAAMDRGVFDTFEVAHVQTVREYKDPIIFGRITGCGDRFYICQWGDDISISDLLASHEG